MAIVPTFNIIVVYDIPKITKNQALFNNLSKTIKNMFEIQNMI